MDPSAILYTHLNHVYIYLLDARPPFLTPTGFAIFGYCTECSHVPGICTNYAVQSLPSLISSSAAASHGFPQPEDEGLVFSFQCLRVRHGDRGFKRNYICEASLNLVPMRHFNLHGQEERCKCKYIFMYTRGGRAINREANRLLLCGDLP